MIHECIHCVCVCVCVVCFNAPLFTAGGPTVRGTLPLTVPENWHVNNFLVVRTTIPHALALTFLGCKKQRVSKVLVRSVSKTVDTFSVFCPLNKRRPDYVCGQSMKHPLNTPRKFKRNNKLCYISSSFTAITLGNILTLRIQVFISERIH